MKKVYEIKLTLKTSLHINAGAGGDGRQIYVKSNGEAYIPATLLKGIVRNNAEMLVKGIDDNYSCNGKENAERSCGCILCRMFGKAGYQPSRVIIDNLYPVNKTKTEIRTNNAINRYTRKTADGALVNREVVSAAENTVFCGEMTVYYKRDMEKYEDLLIKALEMTDSIGSAKSRGLGQVEIEVKECAEKSSI